MIGVRGTHGFSWNALHMMNWLPKHWQNARARYGELHAPRRFYGRAQTTISRHTMTPIRGCSDFNSLVG